MAKQTAAQRRKAAAAAGMGRDAANKHAAATTDEQDPAEPAPAAMDPLLDAITAPSAQEVREAQQEASERIDQLRRFRLDAIVPHPYNPPERLAVDAELRDLGSNIAEYGLHQPLVLAPRDRVVADDPDVAAQLPEGAEWVLIAGHRRWAGSVEAGVAELPGLIRTGPCDPASVAAIFWDENMRRKQPDPIMEAQMFDRMTRAGLSTVQVGDRLGVSQPQVSKTLKLMELLSEPEAAAEMRAGRLTRSDAYEYLSLAESERGPVLQAWRAAAGRAEAREQRPQPLRAHALRHARARAEPHRQHQEAREHTKLADASTVAVALSTELSPTVRADLLADAALYCDETSGRVPWRKAVAEALDISLPKRGSLEGPELSQVLRRKVAVGRALVLLGAEADRYSGHDQAPEHVGRHLQRLRDLGVAPEDPEETS